MFLLCSHMCPAASGSTAMQTSMRVNGPTLQIGSPAPAATAEERGSARGMIMETNLRWGWAIGSTFARECCAQAGAGFAHKVRRPAVVERTGRGQMIHVM